MSGRCASRLVEAEPLARTGEDSTIGHNRAETGLGGIGRSIPHVGGVALISSQGKTAEEIWGAGTKSLWHHLNNGNGDNFTMGFRDDQTGKPRYGKARKSWESASDWAYRSIAGENVGKRNRRICVVVYPKNSRGLSTWCACDADAHDGDWNRAWRLAYAAFRHLISLELFVILEASGAGYHVWAIHKEFLSVEIWSQILRSTAKAIGTAIIPAVFEVFPKNSGTALGDGMRAVGSWASRTDSPNLILFENTSPLIRSLRSASNSIGEPKKSSEGNFPDLENKEVGEVAWLKAKINPFSIDKKGTRNSQLIALTSHVFHQVSKSVAHRLIEIQYETAKASMGAEKKLHVEQFEAAWKGLLETWRQGLSEHERQKYEGLRSENRKSAFRIIWSFARYAEGRYQYDFPIALANLGERIGVTRKGAADIRDQLVRDEIIELTRHYEQQKAAARYRWLLTKPIRSNLLPCAGKNSFGE